MFGASGTCVLPVVFAFPFYGPAVVMAVVGSDAVLAFVAEVVHEHLAVRVIASPSLACQGDMCVLPVWFEPDGQGMRTQAAAARCPEPVAPAGTQATAPPDWSMMTSGRSEGTAFIKPVIHALSKSQVSPDGRRPLDT